MQMDASSVEWDYMEKEEFLFHENKLRYLRQWVIWYKKGLNYFSVMPITGHPAFNKVYISLIVLIGNEKEIF
jgi:hypothetical protein